MASINGKNIDPDEPGVKTSFMRRFSRLSAKTRSKYRNELRRSTSLLELESPTKSETTTEADSNKDRALTDWLGRRLRGRSETKKPESVYIGDTLLKQKPRLRVRNLQKANTLSHQEVLDYEPSERQPRAATIGPSTQGRSRSHSDAVKPRETTTSQSELSEMEQVLFRAARLRNRRGRSASIETRGTDRTSQLDKYSLNTEKISDGYDTDSHDDSFMVYGSCAKTYNAKKDELSPEIVSLSTEYDPNSTSSEFAHDGSSGYASYSSSPNAANSEQSEDLEKKKVVELESPEWGEVSPGQTVTTVARVDNSSNTANESPPSLFYVALVGSDKRAAPSNSSYRVRSGYTGPRENEQKLKKTQSMNEKPAHRETKTPPPMPEKHWLQRNSFGRGSLPVNYPSKHSTSETHGDQISTTTATTRRASCNSRDGFIIKPENVKVTESGNAKDEWKITIKISREKDDLANTSNSDAYSRTSTSEAETSSSSQLGRHTVVREARLRKKAVRSGSSPPTLPLKADRDTQTSPFSTPIRSTTPNEPVIVKSPQHQPDLVSTVKHGMRRRTDVLPDLPRQSFRDQLPVPQSSRRRREEPKNFASILSKWENRCHLSRAASVEVLNEPGTRSRTSSTSTSTTNPRQPATSAKFMNEEKQHRATIEPRPSFQCSLPKTIDTDEGEKRKRLPPLDSGPIFSRSRTRFGSNLTRFNSDTTMLQNSRSFDQTGQDGQVRYQYRQGPIGWKNPIQGL